MQGKDTHSSKLGFVIFGHDNRSYFFGNAPSEIFCPKCDSVIKKDSFFPSHIRVRTGLDVSATYDNRKIVSERFKNLCERERIPGIEFISVHGSGKIYFIPVVARVAAVDFRRRKTRFEDKCEKCGQFESIIGATPAYLIDSKPLGPGFFKSDLEFGSGRAKAPLLFIDREFGMVLRDAKLLGMDLEEISE